MSYINGNRIIKVYIPQYLDLDTVYPVGSVYISVNSTSPASLFGGTWELIQSKFLLGTDDLQNLGATGGEETHTLTSDEMPSHNHRLTTGYSGGTWSTGYFGRVANVGSDGTENVLYDNDTSRTTSVGGGQAHNNMPPYIKVAIWKRTA